MRALKVFDNDAQFACCAGGRRRRLMKKDLSSPVVASEGFPVPETRGLDFLVAIGVVSVVFVVMSVVFVVMSVVFVVIIMTPPVAGTRAQ